MRSAVVIYICIYGIWQTDLSRTTYINAFKVSLSEYIKILVHQDPGYGMHIIRLFCWQVIIYRIKY